MTPVFCTPLDGVLGTLTTAYVPGLGAPLVLSDASKIAAVTPSGASPVRLTVLSPQKTVLSQFICTTQPAGDVVAVGLDAGFADVALPVGSLVAVTASAAALLEIQDAISAVAGEVDALQGATGGVTSVAGRTGAIVLTTADVGGLGSVATHAASDFLTPNGSGAGLTGLNASALESGTVPTARLGSGTASAGNFLRGDGQWAIPPLDLLNLGTAATHSASDFAPAAGSTSIVSVGTIASGTWQGATIAPAYLGSGTPTAGKYLDGSGAWTALPPAPTPSAPGSNGAIPYTLNGQFAASSMVTDGGSVIQFQAGDIAYVQNTGKCLKLSQAGDQYGQSSLELMNRPGVNGARFACDIWLVDFVFLAAQTGVQSNLRFNTDGTILPGNVTAGGGEFVFYMNTGTSSPQFAAQIGAGAAKFHCPTIFVPDSTAGVPVSVQAAPGQDQPLLQALDSTGNPLASITKNGGIKPAQMVDADAESGTFYFSTTAGKLAFKDASGVVHPLY